MLFSCDTYVILSHILISNIIIIYFFLFKELVISQYL